MGERLIWSPFSHENSVAPSLALSTLTRWCIALVTVWGFWLDSIMFERERACKRTLLTLPGLMPDLGADAPGNLLVYGLVLMYNLGMPNGGNQRSERQGRSRSDVT